MDIQTYDTLEARGREAVASAELLRLFSPALFEKSGFPARVRTVYELLPILNSFQGGRFGSFVKELGGLRPDDVDAVAGALADFADLHLLTFGDREIALPLPTMFSQYLLYTKLSGIPRRRRILEIGAGCGYLSFFLVSDPQVERYDQIEITQSLYVLQSLVNRHCYGNAFRNAALQASPLSPVGLLPLDRGKEALFPLRTAVSVPREARAVLHPWWRMDEALSERYDVVTSNANLAEMTRGALLYYLQAIKRCLADDGYFLIQCLGSQAGELTRNNVAEMLLDHGFRPLVAVAGPHEGKHFALDNLLLVGSEHPDYESASPTFSVPVMRTEQAVVRAAYGLDRSPGRSMTRDEFVAAALERIRQRHPSASL